MPQIYLTKKINPSSARPLQDSDGPPPQHHHHPDAANTTGATAPGQAAASSMPSASSPSSQFVSQLVIQLVKAVCPSPDITPLELPHLRLKDTEVELEKVPRSRPWTTEKFYDLFGSLAFATTAVLTFANSAGQGLMDIPLRVRDCHSARHINGMPLNTRPEGKTCVSMRWRATGLADVTRRIIGCHSTQ